MSFNRETWRDTMIELKKNAWLMGEFIGKRCQGDLGIVRNHRQSYQPTSII